MRDIFEVLREQGYPTDVTLDGERVRRDHAGKESFWFFGREFRTEEGKTFVVAHYGDWALGTEHEYTSDTGGFTDAEMEEVRKKSQVASKRREREKQERQDEASRQATERWNAAAGPNGHLPPYLARKGIDSLYGAKTENGGDTLVLPIRDLDGRVWSIQTIPGEPGARKDFMPGGRTKGCFILIGTQIPSSGRLYICEGYATGASIHMATGIPVVCALYADNIEPVAAAIRAQHPDLPLVICGDDDRWKDKNTGREKAERAAQATAATAVFPDFSKCADAAIHRPTDFNDAHMLLGLDEVRSQLQAVQALEPARMLVSLVRTMPNGRQQLPSELQIAQRLLRYYEGAMVKQDRDLFIYTGTHWRHLTQADTDRIKQQIQVLCGGLAETSLLESSFRMLMIYLPAAGRDMFTPAPWVANFKNGTLLIERVPGRREYRLDFRPHSPHDFLVNVLPYDYDPAWETQDWKSLNQEFSSMLGRVFEGDSDAAEKVRALSQMYGAALIPSFPHLFFLHGAAGSGKSTLIKLAARLVDHENMCSVEPKDFTGFNMETMAGKLVNIDTDVDTHQPIADSMIKKIEDRVPMRIRRKGLKDIYAPLPATHIFGGNGIPKTLEGASRAHDRRWTFISFNRPLTTTGDYDREYATFCFEQGPMGVLVFALAGLKDLLANGGIFTQPTSGKERMEEWALETDIVGQFLRDVKEGEVLDKNVQVILDSRAKIERPRTWELFCAWHQIARSGAPRFDRAAFYKRLVEKGFGVKTVKGVRYFSGIGSGTAQGAEF